MKEIQLTQGQVALVDDEDYEYLSQWRWYAKKSGLTFYAVRSYTNRLTGKRYNLKMHRDLLAVESPDLGVDHLDGNGLNNQRDNLRLCSQAENTRNRSLSPNSRSGYKGVYWHKGIGKWHARVEYQGTVHSLGLFTDPVVAAKAYDKKAKELFGNFARLNFQGVV